MSVAEALRAALEDQPTVVLGNQIDRAEELYGPAVDDDGPAYWLDDARAYSEVSTLLAPRPALVVLPAPVPGWVVRAQAELLRLEHPPDVVTGLGSAGSLCRAVRARDDLLERISGCGAPLLPWSATASYDELSDVLDSRVPDPGRARSRSAADRFESKAHANELFNQLAGEHPGVRVPHQDHPTSKRDWIELLEGCRRDGRRAIAKSEYGQAGYGSTFIDADDPRPVPQVVDDLLASDPRFRTGRPAIEEVIAPAREVPYVTVDVVVLGPGEVVIAGSGEMLVRGTHYEGVRFGPGALPGRVRQIADPFARAVGEALAVAGYVGWCCVDLIHGEDGYLWPTEINMRMTGSAIAVAVQRRLLTDTGTLAAVAALDQHPLPRRMSDTELRDWVLAAGRMGVDGEIELAPTITSGRDAPSPSIGLVVMGRSAGDIDAYLAAVNVAHPMARRERSGDQSA